MSSNPFYNKELSSDEITKLIDNAQKMPIIPNTSGAKVKAIVVAAAKALKEHEYPKFEDFDSKISDELDAYRKGLNDLDEVARQLGDVAVTSGSREAAQRLFTEVTGIPREKGKNFE
jgi:hypothetical protein